MLGIDGSRAGWVAVVVLERGFAGADGASSIGELVAHHDDAAVVAIDMPIGLPSTGVRLCDKQARALVGKLHSSVFSAPPQAVLDATSYAEAAAVSLKLSGSGLSRQAYALRARILEVAALAEVDRRVIEVHPEVSFRAMSTAEIAFSKHTWNGLRLRVALLSAHGIELPDSCLAGLAGLAGVDDVVDAAAAAWSAARYAAGEASSLPTGARRGDQPVIWY